MNERDWKKMDEEERRAFIIEKYKRLERHWKKNRVKTVKIDGKMIPDKITETTVEDVLKNAQE